MPPPEHALLEVILVHVPEVYDEGLVEDSVEPILDYLGGELLPERLDVHHRVRRTLRRRTEDDDDDDAVGGNGSRADRKECCRGR